MSEQLKQELEADADRLEAETVAGSETIGGQEEKPAEGKLEAQEGDESKSKEEIEAAEAENAKPIKQKAREKLEAEKKKATQKNFADPVITYLMKRCEEDQGLAEDVMQEGKTWNKCFSYIVEQARKQSNGRSTAVEDQVVYEWAEDYYTVYLLSVILMLIECTESFEQRVTYHSDFSWWKYSLDGSFALDGSINLNHWYPTEFRPVYPFDTVLTENFIADRIFHRIPDVYHENIFKPSFFVRSDFVWWEGFLDGNFSLDGTRKLNSWYPMETFIGHRLFIGNQEAFETKQCISLPDMINAEKADFRGTQRVIMGWRDGNKILDGNCLLDGTLLLDAGEPPYLQTVRIRAPVKHEEEVEVTMVIPSRAARLDGTCRLDGSVKLNSGREVL